MDTNQPKTMGGKGKTEETKPADVVTAAAAPAAPAPTDVVTISRTELNSMLRQAADDAAGRVRADFDRHLERLENAKAAPNTVVMMAKPHRDLAEETTKILDARAKSLEEKDAELLNGPRQFSVSAASQPKATRVVGAIDALHARAKYEAYYGITGVSDPTMQVKVEELT